MKVSVIVPVYNAATFLNRCVDSILKQTYKNLEIILVDDGSTDDSPKICDNYAAMDERVIVFHLENRGAASARNYAISKASGDYLFFVDSDDFIMLDTIESMMNVGKGKDIIYCDYYRYYDDESKEYIKLIPFDFVNNYTHILAMPGPVCKLIKKDIFLENNLYFLEGKYYEDLAIMPIISALCTSVSYLNEAKYYYYQRSGSMMNQIKYSDKLLDIFDSFEYLYSLVEKYKLLDNYYAEIEYLYIEHFLHAAALRFLPFDEGIKSLEMICTIMQEKFPNWHSNKYYKNQSIKYKIVCQLIYKKHYKLLKKILKS